MPGIFYFRIIAGKLKALTARVIRMSNRVKYRSLTALQLQLPVFFQSWWLDTVSQNWDIAWVEKEGKIVAVFPYHSEQKLGIKLLRNPLLTPYLGPYFLYPPALTSFKKVNWEEQMFALLWAQLPAWDSFDIQSTTSFHNYMLFHQKGFTNNNLLTYHVDLQLKQDLLFGNIQSSHRKRISQASELYVIDEGLQYTGDLIRLHEQTFERKSKKYIYSPDLLTAILNNSYGQKAGRLMVAKDEHNKVIGTIFLVWDKEQAYLLLSAVDVKKAHKGTICLLIWQAIVAAQKEGLKIFDFEGSMDAGIEPFFRRFGGERKNYFNLSLNKSRIWKLKKSLLG